MARPNVPAVYQQRMIVGKNEKAVLAELRRRSLAGELHSAAPAIRPITQGPHAGSYAIPVYLRAAQPARERHAPAWRRVAYAAAAALTLAGLVGWVLSTLSGAALAALMIVALLLLINRVRRTTTVTTTVTTKVTIR